MELVDGLTLDKYVKLYEPKVAKILCLAVEVCDALESRSSHKASSIAISSRPISW